MPMLTISAIVQGLRQAANSQDGVNVSLLNQAADELEQQVGFIHAQIAKLQLDASDTILVRALCPISPEIAERIGQHVKKTSGHDKVMVMGPELEISVLQMSAGGAGGGPQPNGSDSG